jgi:hypothetical protein
VACDDALEPPREERVEHEEGDSDPAEDQDEGAVEIWGRFLKINFGRNLRTKLILGQLYLC